MNASLSEKENLRQTYLAKRLSLSPDLMMQAGTAIQERLLTSEIWKGIEWVGLYSAVKNEVETRLLFMKALEAGVSVYFPRVEQGIRFYAVEEPEDLQKGAWGILEPRHECPLMEEVPPNGLVAVPGVVFDQKGYRLGYGKGFYDSVLGQMAVKSVGLAYELQVISSLPAESWDQKVKYLMTEKREFKFV